MSFHYCCICFGPVYQVFSERVQLYLCLNLDHCTNFSVLASEAETIIVAYPPSARTEYLSYTPFETNYPLGPLQAEHSSHKTNQTWVTQPWPQSDIQYDLPQGEDPFLPPTASQTMVTKSLWPLQEEGSSPTPTANQTLVTQQFTQQDLMPAPAIEADHAEPSRAPRKKITAQTDHAEPALAKGSRKKVPAKTVHAELCKAPPKKAPAKMNDDIPAFEKPLSELSNSEGSDPVEEATKYANRSVEQRRWEAQIAGKVKRPANHFILYRMAYQGSCAIRGQTVTKISQLIAKSWAMEGDRVKQSFKALANIDQSLHKQAFPDYKYQPRRNKVPESKDKEPEDVSELEPEYEELE